MDTNALYAQVIRRLGRNARPHPLTLDATGHPAEPSAVGEDDGVLDAQTAQLLWQALLEQGFSAAQEAALLMGLRIHGESAAMLAAFAQASELAASAHAEHTALSKPVIVLPCLGRARRQPSLAPLLALSLQQQGWPVLLMTLSDQGTSNSAGVLHALQIEPCADVLAAQQQLAATQVAWLPLTHWQPALARLIARRTELGFRNSAHTVLRLVAPLASSKALLVTHYTHPPYRVSLAQAAARLSRNALLIRGLEGDPVYWPGALHAPRAWRHGQPVDLSVPTPLASMDDPSLPAAGDDQATARYTQQVLQGQLAPPLALAQQMQLITQLAG